MAEDESNTVRINIAGKPQNLATLFLALIAGGGVYFGFISNESGANANGGVNSEAYHQLELRIKSLETALGNINTLVSKHDVNLSSRSHKRWNYPDQIVFADTLQTKNPELDVPTPKNGQ